jgi:hypothetical protein
LKFKIDENLSTEYTSILPGAGFEGDTVSEEKLSGASDSVLAERCCTEDRVLMTLTWISRMSKYVLQNPILESWSSARVPRQANACCFLKRLVPVLLQPLAKASALD